MHETRRAALAGLIVASFACASAAAQEIKLTLADQNSPTGWGPSHALQPWVKQVEEATKGRVKIEVYPSQTLIKGVDRWKGIRGGIADIGWCVQGYWPEQTPLSDVMSLPFLPISSAEKGSEALWKLYEKFPSMKKEYSETNKAPDALFKTGLAFEKSGDLAMARRAFDECIRRYPYSTPAASAKLELKRIKY